MTRRLSIHTIDSRDDELLLPEGAEILDCRLIDGKPRFYVLSDHTKPKVARKIKGYKLGDDIPDAYSYIGLLTFSPYHAELVFEVPNELT
jgi:hypothetical protein